MAMCDPTVLCQILSVFHKQLLNIHFFDSVLLLKKISRHYNSLLICRTVHQCFTCFHWYFDNLSLARFQGFKWPTPKIRIKYEILLLMMNDLVLSINTQKISKISIKIIVMSNISLSDSFLCWTQRCESWDTVIFFYEFKKQNEINCTINVTFKKYIFHHITTRSHLTISLWCCCSPCARLLCLCSDAPKNRHMLWQLFSCEHISTFLSTGKINTLFRAEIGQSIGTIICFQWQ